MPSGQRRPSARPPARQARTAPPSIDLAGTKKRLLALVEPLAVAAGYDLEDLEVVRMGRRYVLRITVDRDGGVPLDAVAELARAISGALDDAESAGGEVIPGEYQLEVSSPGVSRPLTLPRHWRRNVGRLVKAKVGGHTVIGRVISATDDRVELDVDGTVHDLAYADLGTGRVEIEFSRVDEVDEADMVEFESDDEDDDDESDEDESDEDDPSDDDQDDDDDATEDVR
jgi:ribosome maturation factor RimP